jgi:hypothetical protein
MPSRMCVARMHVHDDRQPCILSDAGGPVGPDPQLQPEHIRTDAHGRPGDVRCLSRWTDHVDDVNVAVDLP